MPKISIRYSCPGQSQLTSDGQTICVLTGTTLQLQAAPDPSGYRFQPSDLTWTGATQSSQSYADATAPFTDAMADASNPTKVMVTFKSVTTTLNVVVVCMALQSISFSGGTDVIDDISDTPDSAPQWLAAPTPNGTLTQLPICYVAGSKPSVKANFTWTTALGAGAKVIYPDTLSISALLFAYPLTDVVLSSNSVDSSGSGLSISGALSDSKDLSAINETVLPLYWYCTNGSSSDSVGQSYNEMFVTLAKPSNPLETVLSTACGPAVGDTTAPAALTHIWGYFATDAVKRFDGTPMSYWGRPELFPNGIYLTGGYTTSGLIANHDGPCDSWSALAKDVFAAQGIASSVTDIYPDVSKFSGEVPAGSVYSIDVNSGAGQNNPSPLSNFNGHVVLTGVNGDTTSVYDPSYGYLASNKVAWEIHSLMDIKATYTDSSGEHNPVISERQSTAPLITWSN